MSFAKTIENLISLLKSESKLAINWSKDNNMIVNPGKFQAMILNKRKGNHTDEIINIDQKEIKVVSRVKLLGIDIDNKLYFNHHIKNICKSASNQLNTLRSLKHFLRFEEGKVLVNTFAMSNFNYFTAVWNFSCAQSLNKIETLQKELYTSC